MRAWQIDGSFGLDHLAPTELPSEPLGPGQVRVAMRAASLNYRDLLMVQGRYNPRQALPLVPCSDGAGEVVEVGADVRSVAVGDRVATCFAQGWLDGPHRREWLGRTLGGPLQGTLREEMVLDELGVVPVPAHLSYEEASTLPCAALTAWSALVTLGGVEPGDTVLLLGTGGVSIFALQLCQLLGARAIVTSSSEAKRQRAMELGAVATLDYRAEPRWGRAVRKLNGGEGVDLVVEVGGAGTLAQSIRAVTESGTIALIGILAEPDPTLDLTPVLMRQIRIQGVFTGHRAGFLAMNDAIARAELHPVVDHVFGFDEVPAAFERMARGAHLGKLVVALG